MRLTDQQKTAIVNTLSEYGELYLYGSRVRDDLKGGDIDLLLVADDHMLKKVRTKKYRLLAQIESVIGEQKIDLTLATPESLQVDLFLKHIYPTAVRLDERG